MIQQMTTRRSALRLALAGAALPLAGIAPGRARADSLPEVVAWKNPSCGCCRVWIDHMRDAGFSVSVGDTTNMAEVKQAWNVPDTLQSCHTAVVSGYVVEGHVPASDIKRLLAERPSARGLAVPGMPKSAPGMDQPGEPYTVVLFGTPTGDKVYAQH